MSFDVPTMNMNNFEKFRKELEKKTHLTTSSDGLVSLQYNGMGEYKNIYVHKELREVDKETLEKDVLDLINYSKNQIQADITEAILNMPDDSQEEKEEDELAEERSDVS